MITLIELITILKPHKEVFIELGIEKPLIKDGKVIFDTVKDIYVKKIVDEAESLLNDDNSNLPIYVANYGLIGEPLTFQELHDMVFSWPQSTNNSFTKKTSRLIADIPSFKRCKKNFWCSVVGIHKVVRTTSHSYVNVYNNTTKIKMGVTPVTTTTIYCSKCGNHSRGFFVNFLNDFDFVLNLFGRFLRFLRNVIS